MNGKPEETQPDLQHQQPQPQPQPDLQQPQPHQQPQPQPQPQPQGEAHVTDQPPPSQPQPQPQPEPEAQGEVHVSDQESEKWGTNIMGTPAPPSSHPNNQKAALWSGEEPPQQHHDPQQQPYVQHSPGDHKASSNPIEPAINVFNTWSHKAESLARNVWQNLKTGNSWSDAVYGKVGLTTKVLTGGGFEALYKQTFSTAPNEKLKKTFACYLSTSTGPVAGTMYLSNFHVAFCSDRPLSFTAPSGQVAWSYYKVMIPLAMINSINPITMKENPPEKYIQITTSDHHDFWFMGFVNYDKATLHLSQSLSEFISVAAQPVVGSPVGGS